MKLSGAFENEQNCLQQLSALKTELEKEKYVYSYIQLYFKASNVLFTIFSYVKYCI